MKWKKQTASANKLVEKPLYTHDIFFLNNTDNVGV